MSKRMMWVLLAVVVVLGAVFAGYTLRGNDSNTITSSGQNNQSSAVGKTVDYSNRGLNEFPQAVLSDTSITVLNLSNNNLSGSLPSQIQNLANLKTLDVSNNKMTGIPAEIGQLNHLLILNYANNKITGLPMELGNLTQLQVLDLRGNNVSQQDLAQIRAKLTNTQIKL